MKRRLSESTGPARQAKQARTLGGEFRQLSLQEETSDSESDSEDADAMHDVDEEFKPVLIDPRFLRVPGFILDGRADSEPRKGGLDQPGPQQSSRSQLEPFQGPPQAQAQPQSAPAQGQVQVQAQVQTQAQAQGYPGYQSYNAKSSAPSSAPPASIFPRSPYGPYADPYAHSMD